MKTAPGVRVCHATNKKQERLEDFSKAFHPVGNTLQTYKYTWFNISNNDQTMVSMNCPANKTNNVVGENTVHIANTGCATRGFMIAFSDALH